MLNRLKEQLIMTARLDAKLKLITDAVVEVFGADFARVWVVKRADLCDLGCIHAAVTEGPHVCRNRDHCLHLVASSGRYTHIDGGHRRVPMGAYKIGRVASAEEPKFITNDVTHDPRVHNHEWAAELGLVSFAGFRLLSPDGKPVGVLALFSKHAIGPDEEAALEDLAITTSHSIVAGMAEEALREERNKARKYFDLARVVMLVLDSSQTVTQINQKGCEVLGFHRSEIIGKNWCDTFIPERNREEARTVFRKVISGEAKAHERYRNPVLTVGGEERLVEWHNTTLREHGRIAAILSSGEDITDRQRAEEDRRRFYRETILSATDGKLDICDAADVEPYISSAGVSMEVREPADLGRALQEVESACRSCGLGEELMWGFAIGIGEAVTNALKHASGGQVFAGKLGDEVWAGVVDSGAGMDSLILPYAVLRRGFSTKPSMGLGYAIILDVSDRVCLKTGPDGTTLILIKDLAKRPPDLKMLPDTWDSIPSAAA